MENKNQAGAEFTAPPFVSGNAELPKSSGQVTKDNTAKKSVKTEKRTVKVVATDKGWFDCRRIQIGDKFMVSEQEFSEKWMEKI